MTPPTQASRRYLDPSSTGFIVLLALATAMQAIGTNFTVPALPAMTKTFATTTDMVQLTLSGYLAGLASGQIFLGALSDRFGRRPVLLQTFNQSLAALRASGAADELERRWLGGVIKNLNT